MDFMYIRPVQNDWEKDDSIMGTVVALYKGESLNMGYPAIAPYQPALGNMWGFNKATEKGFFEILPEMVANITTESPVYVAGVDTPRMVVQFITAANEMAKENPIFGSDNEVVAIPEEETGKKLRRA